MNEPFENNDLPEKETDNIANDPPIEGASPMPDVEASAQEAPAEPVTAAAPDGEPSEPSRPDGEYHYISPEETRAAYSDAGYVPSSSASTVPPRYHCSAPAAPKPKKEKKRRSISAGGVIAACLVCALLGGVVGGTVGSSRGSDSALSVPAEDVPEETGTVINVASPPQTSVSTNLVSSGEVMSASDIYAMACTQAVAITTEITYTNVFGYASSGAVSGSGFIISSDGYILTNYHVIEDANEGGYEVTVMTYDGTKYTATIVGYEKDNDVAVLKIDAMGLNAVTIGDSGSMQVGDSVYAVGNPLGELAYSMTSGMVSALDREITSSDSSTGTSTTINMFQIDAAVNSGNSGGPVFNSRGQVIGIVTAKYSDTGVEGLGFAIPINDAISIANELITNGYVSGKAYMGVVVQTVSSSVAQYYNMVVGAYVYSIEAGGCAEKAGLKVGDIIVKIGDTEVASSSDLSTAKKDYRAGESATLSVYRSGEYIDLTIVFDEEIPAEDSAVEEPVTGEAQTQEGYYSQIPGFGNSQVRP